MGNTFDTPLPVQPSTTSTSSSSLKKSSSFPPTSHLSSSLSFPPSATPLTCPKSSDGTRKFISFYLGFANIPPSPKQHCPASLAPDLSPLYGHTDGEIEVIPEPRLYHTKRPLPPKPLPKLPKIAKMLFQGSFMRKSTPKPRPVNKCPSAGCSYACCSYQATTAASQCTSRCSARACCSYQPKCVAIPYHRVLTPTPSISSGSSCSYQPQVCTNRHHYYNCQSSFCGKCYYETTEPETASHRVVSTSSVAYGAAGKATLRPASNGIPPYEIPATCLGIPNGEHYAATPSATSNCTGACQGPGPSTGQPKCCCPVAMHLGSAGSTAGSSASTGDSQSPSTTVAFVEVHATSSDIEPSGSGTSIGSIGSAASSSIIVLEHNHDTKVTSWLPPQESWNSFQSCAIPPVHSLNSSQLLSSSSASPASSVLSNATTGNVSGPSISPSTSTTNTTSSEQSSSTDQQLAESFARLKLPYGWEEAENQDGLKYYINHINSSTTFELPPPVEESEPEPEPRFVTISRDKELDGFGFVAGSEKPVVVRFISEGGPSEHLLETGDELLEVNGQNVYDWPKDKVIQLIKSSGAEVKIKCCQPKSRNKERKSNLLTSAKKARLRKNPPRVRFAEGVVVNGSPLFCSSMDPNACSPTWLPLSSDGSPVEANGYPREMNIPFIPNVLKVFLENGQTKTFKYDSTTTVQSVLDSLFEKLGVKCTSHYGLVCDQIRSMQRNKLLLLDPNEALANVAARPNAHNLRCMLRIVYMLPDPFELMQKDPVSFEYLYQQCCNDIVNERYQPEIKYEIALRLAALKIVEHALPNGFIDVKSGKVNLKKLDAECGLNHFVPLSLFKTMKRKELIRVLSHSMKLNAATLMAPGQKTMTPLHCKVQFLKILSDLPCYGSKTFANNYQTVKSSASKPLPNGHATNGNQPPKLEIGSEQHYELDQSPTAAAPAEEPPPVPPLPYPSHPLANESTVLLSPKYGLSFLSNTPLAPITVVRLEDVTMVKVTKSEDSGNQLAIQVFGTAAHSTALQLHPNTDKSLKDRSLKEPLMHLALETLDAQEFVLLLKGYNQLLGEINNNSNHSTPKGSLGRSGTRAQFPLQIIWECPNDDWWNDGAPRYYGTHTVFGSNWNYPPRGDPSDRYLVDLALAPPHYSQLPPSAHRLYPKAGKSKSNPLRMSGVTEVVKSIDSRDSQLYTIESARMDGANTDSNNEERPQSIDMPSLVSMEILESAGQAASVDPGEVEHRVTEMNRILKDAEKYLHDFGADTLEKKKPACIQDGLEKLEQQTITQKVSETVFTPSSPKNAPDSEAINANVTTTTAIVHSEAQQQPHLPSPTSQPLPLNDSGSSSFALQTAGSRISTLDMLPQLLQAETDLAEMARSLRTPPLTTNGEVAVIVQRETPSPHRLSHLIASLEAAQEQLTPDVIDLTTLPPPRTPERGISPEVLHYLQLNPPQNQNFHVGYVSVNSTPASEELLSKGAALPAPKNSLDASRVVAELETLCDTLLEMKSSLSDSSLTKSAAGPVSTPPPPLYKQPPATPVKASELLDNSLLLTFDQLTASINELIKEDPNAPGSELIAKMVIPPPPPDSPTQIKEQDEVIRRFWEATEDVKHMIATRKLQQQQRQQQQLAYLQQQQALGLAPTVSQLVQHFTDPPPYPTAGGGGLSSDSTAINTSSDSESDLAGGAYHFGGGNGPPPSYGPYSAFNNGQNIAYQPTSDGSPRHHQHHTRQPISPDEQSRPKRPEFIFSKPLSQEAYIRQLMANHVINAPRGAAQPIQQPQAMSPFQHQMDQFNGNNFSANSPQTTPSPPVRKLSNPLLDAQMMALLSQQQPPQFQELAMKQHQEMIYSHPFPPLQQQPANQMSSPSYPNLQQMLLNYHQHQTGLAFEPRNQQPMIRSQSLTLLPTGGPAGVQPNCLASHSASTPPPQFPVSASPVDINSLLGQYVQPNLPPSTDNSPTTNNSNSAGTVIYTGGGRSSPRFPKPPIPPSSPSIKEKRRQQAILKSNSFKDSDPTNGQTGPELILVNYGNGGSPSHPPPPYHSAHHHHHPCSAGAGSSSSGSNSSFSPELTTFLASSALAASPGTQMTAQSKPTFAESNSTNSSPVTSKFQLNSSSGSPSSQGSSNQYFLPGVGSTIVMNSETSDSSGTGSINPTLYGGIPESKRICFQTKEMEEIFNQSQYDIDTLLARLEEVHEGRLRQTVAKTVGEGKSKSKDGSPSSARETLIVESRHFVTASKFFVKCATEGSFQLIDYLTECVTLLERMFHASETVIYEMDSGAQVTCLVDRLKEVAATYAYTVDTVRRLVGFSPDNEQELPAEVIGSKRPNPFLDLLMNHATSLATCLSTLMRTLRTMN